MTSYEAVAVVIEGRVRVRECIAERLCQQLRGAGAMSGDSVDVLEAAYQVVRGRLVVEGYGSGWAGALKLVNDLLGDVDLFIVYYDLRRRGRRVKRGIRRRTLHMIRGKEVVEVLVLSEGTSTSVRELFEWSSLASGDDHVPVIAVVDGYGEVTYYEARASGTLS